ncbi:hypothetical protein VPH35_040463 [Triticum aestivum]|uniref:Uncharacterized protein n=1 Tax=Triticum aestivum TaxID=4565 RepID=A0A3B6DKE2_WHEAT
METTTSSSSGSGSLSSGSPTLCPVNPEQQEMPLGRRSRSGALVFNEGGRPSPSSSRLVRPKTEPGLLPVKKEHADMATADETAIKWARVDYVRKQMERQPLLEKRLLVAHLFLLLMAHYRCVTINTPLVTNSNGTPLVRH